MTHKQKRIFFNWLQKHNALEKYKHNRFVFMHKYHKGIGDLHCMYAFISVNLALATAFSWVHTPEGDKYWSDLDNAWLQEYPKIMGGECYDTETETHIF